MSRFMLMLRATEDSAAGQPPQALYEAIGKAAEQWRQEGVLVDTAGMAPTSAAVRIHLADGQITTSHGPFDTGTETTGAYAIINADTQEQAVARATEFLELHKEHWPAWRGHSEVRQLFG